MKIVEIITFSISNQGISAAVTSIEVTIGMDVDLITISIAY
jgi:hypothetical protein